MLRALVTPAQMERIGRALEPILAHADPISDPFPPPLRRDTTMQTATPSPVQSTPDFNAIKQRQQATWASGDYAAIGTTLQIVGETLAEAADVRAGEPYSTSPPETAMPRSPPHAATPRSPRPTTCRACSTRAARVRTPRAWP